MRPTAKEIGNVIAGWTCLKYFPPSPGAMKPIATLIADMVSTVEQLAWLDSAMLNQVGEWPGPAEVRAIFCTRFKPADGIEGKAGYSTIAGFTPSEIEAEKLIEHDRLTADPHQRQLGGAQIANLLAEPVEPVTDEERASINALAEKIEARLLNNAAEKRERLTQRARRRVAAMAEAFVESNPTKTEPS